VGGDSVSVCDGGHDGPDRFRACEWRSMDYKKFAQRWVKNLMVSMDAHLDEETRIRLMESCGRACARTGPARVAKSCQGNLDEWLATLARWHGGEEYVHRDGDVVEVTCAECLCDLVKDGPARLPDTYCYCSLGWMKETFEAVVEKPVDVALVESIKRGDQRCRFTIRL
jgi:predicted hydrocarbon binding protein